MGVVISLDWLEKPVLFRTSGTLICCDLVVNMSVQACGCCSSAASSDQTLSAVQPCGLFPPRPSSIRLSKIKVLS